MGMLDKFRVSRAIDVLLSSPDIASSERTQALTRLKQAGKAALPKLIQALGRTTDPVLIDLLVALLDNTSLPLYCQGLKNPDKRVVGGIVKVLSKGHKYDANQLLDLFTDPEISKPDLVNVLTTQKEKLQPRSLLNLLNVVDKAGRSAVFQLIDQVASEAMVTMLVPSVEHPDWVVRLHVMRTLSRFSTEIVRDTFIHSLADPHKNVRQAALEGLASLHLPVDVAPLCQLLRDPDLMVQSKAIETIIQINDPRAMHHLLDILQDESEYVRRAAVEVLNAVGNTHAIKDLLEALRDKDWWVRVRASDALGHIGGPRVVEAILPLLKDPDAFIRRCVVEVLNTTKDERAFEHLVAALQDEDWWVRERAVDALANLGDKRAVSGLVGLLGDETDTTPAVIRALAALADSRATRPLLAKLHSPDKAVKHEALRALASLTDATQAGEVQQAIAQVMSDGEPETKELAQGTQQAIVSKFGQRACRTTASPSGATTIVSPTDSQTGGENAAGDSSACASSATRDRAADLLSEKSMAASIIDPMALQTGDVLASRYRVIHHIGRGAFGVVVLVEDVAVHEEIILKFLNPHLAANSEIIKRFVHEMRYTRRITHENVIRIYDFITLGKSFAISMEYFPSHPLATEMKEAGTMVHHRGLRILHDICRGLSVAHQASIVHRDLKPQNILVNDDGLVKIVDFGLAAAVSQTDSRLTGSGVLMGTPAYMAPEQARGLDIDPRTDIYSLGVIMYEMFTGQPPYQGPEPISVIYQHVEGKAVAPRQLNPHLPAELEAIVLKAMAVAPDERYQSAETLRTQLEALLSKEWANGAA